MISKFTSGAQDLPNHVSRMKTRILTARLQSQIIANAMPDTNEVASVFVYSGENVLMGQRKDNDKWTLPGGHVNKDESIYQAAVRELYEETNLRGKEIEYYGVIHTSEDFLIHLFVWDVDLMERGNEEISTKNDPDDEVYEWQWVKIGTPEYARAITNLHGTVIETFKALGLVAR